MFCNLKTGDPGDLSFEILKYFIFDIDNCATVLTHDVIMSLTKSIIARKNGFSSDLLNLALLLKQLQISIDGTQADVGERLANFLINPSCRRMGSDFS